MHSASETCVDPSPLSISLTVAPLSTAKLTQLQRYYNPLGCSYYSGSSHDVKLKTVEDLINPVKLRESGFED
ncbi:hypothetical protein [Absidia glauca]|uniref:Uncharacterized protein n=1 Tax=Absidia glauca TaxID=4829 RepID=A0A163MRV8_ABSGL|nr:hypothetical protein [Absidia glauca]